MKKILVTLMAVLCVMTCGVAAENKTTDDMDVTYSVAEEYQWSVPTKIAFTADEYQNKAAEGNDGKVKIEKNVIASDKVLNIHIATDEDFLISDGVSPTPHTLSYSVKGAADLAADSIVVSAAAGINTADQAITGTLTKDGVEQAGSYSGKLNFYAAVEAAA